MRTQTLRLGDAADAGAQAAPAPAPASTPDTATRDAVAAQTPPARSESQREPEPEPEVKAEPQNAVVAVAPPAERPAPTAAPVTTPAPPPKAAAAGDWTVQLGSFGEVRLGWIGQVHPRLAKALDLDVEVVGFELDLEPLEQRALPRAADLSRYPAVRRDLAFVVAADVTWAALSDSVRAAAGPVLRDLLLFDRYQGPGVESGCKSLAMGLILQDNARTLTDQDADALVERVVAGLGRDHGARIRG